MRQASAQAFQLDERGSPRRLVHRETARASLLEQGRRYRRGRLSYHILEGVLRVAGRHHAGRQTTEHPL